MRQYPSSFSRFLSNESRGACIEELKESWAAWAATERQGGRFWVSWRARSVFQDPWTCKVVRTLVESGWRLAEELKVEIESVFGMVGGTKCAEDGFRELRNLESLHSGWNTHASKDGMFHQILQSGVLHDLHRYSRIPYDGEEVPPDTRRKGAMGSLFKPKPKATPDWLRQIMGKSSQTTWFSTVPANEVVHFVDDYVQKSYLNTDRWEHADALWLCLLVAGECVLLTHQTWGGRIYLVLGMPLRGRLVVAWPVVQIAARAFILQLVCGFQDVQFSMVDRSRVGRQWHVVGCRRRS